VSQGEIERAARTIRRGGVMVFSGAGVSVESGISPFRGAGGLWSRYDPSFLEIGRFMAEPEECWRVIREIFYGTVPEAQPNAAHLAIADLEAAGYVHVVVTQNIDGLHQLAGSRNVLEFHGTTRALACTRCGRVGPVGDALSGPLPPICAACGGVLKPDCVFFGEPIPEEIRARAFEEAARVSAVIVVGTMGEVVPASYIPRVSKENGACVIEVNTEASAYTSDVTDLFLRGRATEVLPAIARALAPGVVPSSEPAPDSGSLGG